MVDTGSFERQKFARGVKLPELVGRHSLPTQSSTYPQIYLPDYLSIHIYLGETKVPQYLGACYFARRISRNRSSLRYLLLWIVSS